MGTLLPRALSVGAPCVAYGTHSLGSRYNPPHLTPTSADVDIAAPLDKANFTVWVIDRLRLEDAEDLTVKVGLREFLKRFEALQRPKKGTLSVTAGMSVTTDGLDGPSVTTPTSSAS